MRETFEFRVGEVKMVGVRRGLLRPRSILLLSPKAWKAIEAAKLRGLGFEVAGIV